jgi:hypothetical protein
VEDDVDPSSFCGGRCLISPRPVAELCLCRWPRAGTASAGHGGKVAKERSASLIRLLPWQLGLPFSLRGAVAA